MDRVRHPAVLRKVVAASAVSLMLAGSGIASMTPALAGSSGVSHICASAKRPKLAARISADIAAALAGRTGSVVGLAAADPAADLTCRFHQKMHFYAASVIKVTIISALLLKEHGPHGMTKAQRNLAYLMITQSNNDAAQDLWQDVGMTDMQRFLDKADMRHTELNDAWGLTLLTAQDELTLLHLLTNPGKVLGRNSRSYVLWLMAHVIPTERWGVPAGAPSDVTVHVKNGWLPYPGSGDWHINSIGAFTGHDVGYQIVVLTGPPAGHGQGESYGIETVQAVAEVINHQIAGRTASSSSASLPGPAALAAPGG
jgi:hypothetical protein